MSVVPSENDEHRALADFLRMALGEPGIVNSDGVLWFSTELRNAHSKAEGARRKAVGCVPGQPDITIRYTCANIFHIELKRTKRGGASKDQRQFHKQLRLLGDEVAICRGWIAAVEQIRAWRIPMKSVRIAA